MNNREKIIFSPEHEKDSEALEQAGNERREQLRDNLEKVGEEAHENVDEIRHEALERATSTEKRKVDEEDHLSSPAERRRSGPISRQEREASFKSTMNEVQNQMSGPSRIFSRVIHNKAIEKASDITADTIARPNAMLSGSIFAFILTLGVYITARNMGYPLSGFESIGAFVLGWTIGIIYDFLKVMVTGRR
jgi:hypothetical protein